MDEYELLDRIRCQGMLYAEKQCRKLKLGKVPWSPQLSLIWKRLEAWYVLKRRCQGRNVNDRYLQRLLHASQIEIPDPLNAATCSEQEKACWMYYCKVKKSADMIREGHLESLATALATKNQSRKSTELKILRAKEKQRSQACNIKAIQDKLQSGGVKFVTVIDEMVLRKC